MAKMNMLHAINSALDITMNEHPQACIFGEDVMLAVFLEQHQAYKKNTVSTEYSTRRLQSKAF